MSGDRSDVDKTTVDALTDKLPMLCNGHGSRDFCDMDETELFYRATTKTSYHAQGEACAGGNRYKEHLTVALYASMV